MRKIISFIIGCLIGGILGTIQIQAWAAEPIGYSDFVEIDNPEEYLKHKGVDVPIEVKNICEEYGEQYNICPELLEAICWKESRFFGDVQNKNCIGIMQVNAKVHKGRMKRLGVNDLRDIDGNIHTGADYLSTLMQMNGNLTESLNEYGGHKTGRQTKYTSEILKIASALEAIGGE